MIGLCIMYFISFLHAIVKCNLVSGPVSDFLSWKGFVPLSRMTFMVYLIHPVLMVLTVYTRRSLIYINDFDMVRFYNHTLRKHAHSNILKILPPKNKKKNQMKKSDIFHISAQNIDCGYSLEPPRRGGSNEYYNLCFWAEIRKIMYTPVNPSFTI